MIKLTAIGNLGRDAEVHIHESKTVINFSIAHTEKYKDRNGTVMNKTVWISCAWWTEKTTIAQYLKKGTQVYIEGFPGIKMWRDNAGENKCDMTCRILSVQLLGTKKEEGQNSSTPAAPAAQTNTGPTVSDIPQDTFDDLPF